MLPIVTATRVMALLVGLSIGEGDVFDPGKPDSRVDVSHYVFRINVSDSSDTIHGHTTATVVLREDGVNAIILNLVATDGSRGMQVRAVKVDGESSEFEHSGDELRIPVSHQPAGRYQIDVTYDGIPEDGLIISTNRHGDRTFFGDNWPNRARHWLPVVDHPSDKATCEFLITAPAHYQVIASGRRVEETDLENDLRLTHSKTVVPLATKVMVFGAARFAIDHVGEVDGIPVESWVYPQDRDDGFKGYRIAKEVLSFFVDKIGPFPYKKLANVQSKTRYGGMENAGNIFYSEGSVSPRGTSVSLIAHEIAHQWFGDSVSERDWYHVWLSEGFATYMASLYAEHADGREALDNGLQLQRAAIVDYHRRNPDSPVVDTTITNLNDLLSTNSYQKGGWVLHMLRREVGDDQFWRIIRNYYSRYRDGNAVTSDFKLVAEEATELDLDWFFTQWLHHAGQPALTIGWSYDGTTGQTTINVEQTQTGPLFIFNVDLGLVNADGRVAIHTMRIESRATSISVPSPEKPVSLVPDPQTNLLATFSVEG